MKNGSVWLDDMGKPIQAHGGMVAKFEGKWYWYGENKDAENAVHGENLLHRVDVIGVSCYSSDDLHTWHYEGLALNAAENGIAPERVLERPKVIYAQKTGKYVMWFHHDSADYTYAHAGCAVSDSPVGPFKFLHDRTPGGRDCRDMTIYEDPTDGSAYIVHSGDWNKTLYFSKLNDERTDLTGESFPQLIDQQREAPALMYHNGLHYCVTSGCTGWAPNCALYATASHIGTGMRLVDNPCEGPDARNTFFGQSTYIFENDGQAYLMLDHWKPAHLRESGYSFLPITFEGDRMTVTWVDEF